MSLFNVPSFRIPIFKTFAYSSTASWNGRVFSRRHFSRNRTFVITPHMVLPCILAFFDAIIEPFWCELVLFHHVIFSRKQLSPTTRLSLRAVIQHHCCFTLHVNHRVIVNIFLIWITIAGHEELAGRFRQTTNGEIF